MLRPCLTCGDLVESGSYCPADDPDRHRPRTTPGRGGGSTITVFRAAVLAKAGHRCEVVKGGTRCTVTGAGNLEAHHLRPLREGGTNDPANGRACCRRHHRMIETLGAT
jgi:predicted restriction endonuclease